ncbi:MAG: hypothetical protein ACRDJH_14575 [Thermomicrobiales bacterium]
MATLMSAPTVEHKIRAYLDARRAGVAYLLRHLNADGSIGPVERGVYYYRVPWVLAISGETVPATRLIAWIRRHMLTPEGEFAGAPSPDGAANSSANTYAETCLAYGAHLLRQFDVAKSAMRFALRFQDPETGGIFMDRQRLGPDDPQILYLTCQFGMSALVTGQYAAAESAGQWVKRLWEAQPELPDRLYTISTRAGGLATAVPTEADRRHYVNESQEVREMHYNGGIAAAFLTRLYQATGDASWLDLARQYQSFSMNSTERQFEVMQVCKSGWGSALLYLVTGEPLYRDWTVTMGDWFVANQHADGHWENSRYVAPDSPLESNLATTAEFVNHLDCIAGALAAGSVA